MSTCARCFEWGETITILENPEAISCPTCGRLTWPNLGVNCPAGSAWSFAGTFVEKDVVRKCRQVGRSFVLGQMTPNTDNWLARAAYKIFKRKRVRKAIFKRGTREEASGRDKPVPEPTDFMSYIRRRYGTKGPRTD